MKLKKLYVLQTKERKEQKKITEFYKKEAKKVACCKSFVDEYFGWVNIKKRGGVYVLDTVDKKKKYCQYCGAELK